MILVRTIIEMAGAPKEHVDKTLHDFVKSIKDNHKIKVKKSDYSEPEQQDKMFNQFVELELEAEELYDLVIFCMEAMPSSIEILEPDTLHIDYKDLTDMLNDLQGKLHTLDMKLKQYSAQNRILEDNVKTLAANCVGLALAKGPRSAEELEKDTGIPLDKLTAFLSDLEKEKRVKLEDGNYTTKNGSKN
ncbi:hypothetical protein H6504_02130 [Candidatus Woesearchaeota archaeon]|nr:hypothetical protein [Candidatus Woesearchaeota archaeon]